MTWARLFAAVLAAAPQAQLGDAPCRKVFTVDPAGLQCLPHAQKLFLAVAAFVLEAHIGRRVPGPRMVVPGKTPGTGYGVVISIPAFGRLRRSMS